MMKSIFLLFVLLLAARFVPAQNKGRRNIQSHPLNSSYADSMRRVGMGMDTAHAPIPKDNGRTDTMDMRKDGKTGKEKK